MIIYIYSLIIEETIYYIGATNNPKKRLAEHVLPFEIASKDWLKTLIKSNIFPRMKILEKTTIEKAKELEDYFLKRYQYKQNRNKRSSYNSKSIKSAAQKTEYKIGEIISLSPQYQDKILFNIKRKFPRLLN